VTWLTGVCSVLTGFYPSADLSAHIKSSLMASSRRIGAVREIWKEFHIVMVRQPQ
jgi:hypothetical protein